MLPIFANDLFGEKSFDKVMDIFAAATPVAVANLVTHICILISVVVGIVRYDILKK